MSLRAVWAWGYTLAFGSLYGAATVGFPPHSHDGSTDVGLSLIALVIAVVGFSLVGFKYHLITERRVRTWVTLSDGAVLLAAFVLIAVLPSSLGMSKGLVLLAVFLPYIVWWFRKVETIQTT